MSLSKPELEFQPPLNDWRPAASQAAGVWERILSLDPVTGDCSRLVRWERGVDTSGDGALTHDFWEEVYIVSGDLTDLRLNQRFTAGMYACRPPGMVHGPWKSDQGALMVEFRYAEKTTGRL